MRAEQVPLWGCDLECGQGADTTMEPACSKHVQAPAA